MKCDRDACPNQAAKGERHCADAHCKRVRDAMHARSRGNANPGREVAPIVSRDEVAAAAASQPKPTTPAQPERVASAPVLVPGRAQPPVAQAARKPEPAPKPRKRQSRAGPYWDALNALSRQLIEAEVAKHTCVEAVAKALGLQATGIRNISKRLGIELPDVRAAQEKRRETRKRAKLEALRAQVAALEAEL